MKKEIEEHECEFVETEKGCCCRICKMPYEYSYDWLTDCSFGNLK